jgi:isocitrate dehydrogenase (NAD+)
VEVSVVHNITLIPGDGIGPEVAEAAVAVVEASGVQVRWHRVEAGGEVAVKHGTALPDHVLNSVRTNRVALKGPVTTPIGGGFGSVNVALRKELDLYACVRPVRSLPGVQTRYEDIDLLVVRENTEGLYSGIEHLVVPGVAVSLKVITENASTRIAKFAFELARRQKRRKITAVHKANIMKLSDGLFLECVRHVRRHYPEIEYEEMIVDSVCMNLVKNPHRFDVLLLENLYGDIVSDLCAGLVGGLGVVPGANIGDECAVFEAVHGSAPDIAGRGIANPTAIILSAIMMLEHIGETDAARRITCALYEVLRTGEAATPDVGGCATTMEMAEAICRRLRTS